MNLAADYFSNFAVEKSFTLDIGALAQTYRSLQQAYHPDRFAQASPEQQRLALQTTAYINNAYATLKSPLKRALYLLQLEGMEPLAETNTHMPADFLLQQIEWRETLEACETHQDTHGLEQLRQQLAALALALAADFDHHYQQQAWSAAEIQVRKMQFIHKLQEEIQHVQGRLLEVG